MTGKGPTAVPAAPTTQKEFETTITATLIAGANGKEPVVVMREMTTDLEEIAYESAGFTGAPSAVANLLRSNLPSAGHGAAENTG